MTLEVRLGYRNKRDPVDKWTEYASSSEERQLDCEIHDEHKKPGYMYNCSTVPLFELGSLHHDYYLLNIRLPNKNNKNLDIGRLQDIWVAVSYLS